MADQASSSITIKADRSAVMAVIADFAAYPEWTREIKQVTVEETDEQGRGTQATFTLDAGVLKDTYTLAYDWDENSRVDWHLVKGRALKAQDGTYELRDTDGGTEVTYRLSVDLAVPMLGMFKRKAEKMIMDAALKGLKKRVEG